MTAAPTAPADLPTGEAKRTAVRSMFDQIAPRYDAVNKVMTFGLDLHWRRRTVRLLGLPARSKVLDLACGTGDFVRALGRAGNLPVGVDLSAGMLAHARAEGHPLLLADGARLPLRDGAVDGAVSGFALRNFSDLPAVLAELARVVAPGGRIALLDAAEPTAPLLAAGHRLWFHHVVPRIGALLSDGPAYRYLPRSLSYLPPPSELEAMIAAAGFESVRRRTMTGGAVQVFTGTRSR